MFAFSGGLSPWLADGPLLAVCSQGLSFLCANPCVSSNSDKDTRHIGLGHLPDDVGG